MSTPQMQHASAIVVQTWLAGGHTLQTRLRERAQGELHDLPALSLLTLPAVASDPEAILRALEVLEREGIVVQSEAVHVYDSAEYTLTWRLAGSRV